jgi:orotate phosphoribosyltransferase
MGFRNGFDYISVLDSTTPKHLGGSGIPEIKIDSLFFDGAFVLLFDDLVTSGKSILHYSHLLEEKGATCIGVLSLGQTVL